jgi:hypothetical protein
LLLAEGHLTRRLFAGMLAKIAMLPSPAAKPVPSGAAGNTVGQDGVKPCKGKPFDVANQLELKGQKGNPVLDDFFAARDHCPRYPLARNKQFREISGARDFPQCHKRLCVRKIHAATWHRDC